MKGQSRARGRTNTGGGAGKSTARRGDFTPLPRRWHRRSSRGRRGGRNPAVPGKAPRLRPGRPSSAQASTPIFLITSFSGARKWLPGCPGVLPRIRLTLPGGSGRLSPDPEISAGSPGRFDPVPVCFVRESRAVFPGSGLPCPGVPAGLPRYRFALSGSPGRFSPDPEISVGSPGRFDPDPVQTRRASRTTFPGSGENRPGIGSTLPRGQKKSAGMPADFGVPPGTGPDGGGRLGRLRGRSP